MPKDPDILVDLTTARTAFEAEMIAETLRAQGIPAEAFTTAGSMLQWDIAATQPMRVQVRRRDLDRARDSLRAIRADSVDLDWSEVDTGDRTPVSDRERAAAGDPVRIICRRCGYDVTGLPISSVCPECGASLGEPWPVRPARPMKPGRRALFVAGLMCVAAAAIASGFVVNPAGGWPGWLLVPGVFLVAVIALLFARRG